METDYKKLYEQALERAKEWHDDAHITIGLKGNLENIFPELKESGDEESKNWILEYLYDGLRKSDEQFKDQFKSAIAWLENKVDNAVKPKFKVGDWIVFNNDHKSVYQVKKIENYEYTLRHILGGSMPLSFSHEDMIRAWTIKDAMDGDVLATENFIFIFKNIDDNNYIHYYCHYEIYKHEGDDQFDIALPQSLMGEACNSHYSPATKEQREQLEKAMKEAGYEWDSEKKELKKIEQKLIDSYCKDNCKGYQETGKCFADGKCKAKRDAEQNPTWSEDDEKNLGIAILALEKPFDYEGKFDRKAAIQWLKSLKPQSHWKPTEEQLMALRDAIDNNEMESLYNDLKKL